MKIFSWSTLLRSAAFGLIVLSSACNLHVQRSSTPSANLPSSTQLPPAVPTVAPAGAAAQVEILSPQNGAEVPAGAALTVTARWSGGDAIEASLSVDAQIAADQPGPIPAGQEIQLMWTSPTAGKHSLTAQFLDDNKNPHEASIEILVSASAESATATPAAGGAAISFLSLSENATLAAAVDSGRFRPGRGHARGGRRCGERYRPRGRRVAGGARAQRFVRPSLPRGS